MMKAAIFLALLLATSAYAVEWVPGRNWTFRCDFPGNDIGHVRMQGSQCGGACWNNPRCTHFTWTTIDGGTCMFKSGSVTQGDAVDVSNPSWVCGIIR